MLTLYRYLFLFFILAGGCNDYNQQTINPEQILEHYVEKLGGKEKWESIRTAKYILETEIDSLSGFKTIFYKEPPGKYCMVTLAGNRESRIIYNNGKAGKIVDGISETITDQDEIERLKLSACILPDMVYKEMGYNMKLLGIEKWKGTNCYKIKLTSPSGKEDLNFYEKESGLLSMIIHGKGTKSLFNEYKEFDGCLFPVKMSYVLSNDEVWTITVKEVHLNKIIEESVFSF